jgi:hypothetical protein
MNLSIPLLKIKYVSYIFTITFFLYTLIISVHAFAQPGGKNKAGMTIYSLGFQPPTRQILLCGPQL